MAEGYWPSTSQEAQEDKHPAEITAAVEAIDGMLARVMSSDLLSTADVTDQLLDVRNILIGNQ